MNGKGEGRNGKGTRKRSGCYWLTREKEIQTRIFTREIDFVEMGVWERWEPIRDSVVGQILVTCVLLSLITRSLQTILKTTTPSHNSSLKVKPVSSTEYINRLTIFRDIQESSTCKPLSKQKTIVVWRI